MAHIVKSEPKQEQLDDVVPSYSLSVPQEFGWKELDYLDASSWSKDEIIKHLVTNSFSVPGRTHRSKWATITSADGSTTVVPNVYRIPLMFVGQFMWSSLQLVLGDETEWNDFKTGILYVSRLCEAFLTEVRRAMSEEGIGRSWRFATFDRALTRYRMGWLLSEPKYLKDFWEMYGDEEYQKDPVKFDWKRLVTRGIKGFKVEEEQVEGGISATEWMDGLRELRSEWLWDKSSNTQCGRNACEYLESWQRTKVWEKLPPSRTLSTNSEAAPVKPQSKLDVCHPPAPPFRNSDSAIFTPLTPSSEIFKLLRENFESQDRRIALLEKEVSKLRTAQAEYLPVVVPDPIPVFVPTPNFPEISDPDCAMGFWRKPLEKFLDVDMEEVESLIKTEPEAKMQVDFPARLQEETGSGPVKSLRKRQRMED